MTMRPWMQLKDTFAGRDVVVVGNGPSRVGRSERLHAWADAGKFLIACNAYWRDRETPGADYLVCYEAAQAEAALAGDPEARVLVAQQGADPLCTMREGFLYDGDHLYEAAPLHGAGDWEAALDDAWWPTVLALGNLSGLLAYQLAMVGRPRAVYLFGVDCCGLTVAGSDQVVLSAIDGAPGYGPARAPARAMVGGPKTPMPEGWDQYRSLWRALTRRAEQAGIPTFRALDAGALDWLEVKDPCPD